MGGEPDYSALKGKTVPKVCRAPGKFFYGVSAYLEFLFKNTLQNL